MKRHLITIAECAEYLGFHHCTIRRMVDRGQLPAFRIGRSLRIDLKLVEKILEDQQQPQAKGRG